MSVKIRLAFLLAVAALASFAGCVPSDAEIAGEMSQARREAYIEWKSMRDRGDTREVKADGPLSLNDAIKMALQYNKPLQSALQEREYTRGERISAYAVILPNLSANGGATRIENGRGNDDIDNYSLGLTVTQPIMQGEKIPARLRTARLTTALTDEKIREQVQELIAAVSGNYYDVLLAQHMVETHREALVSAEAQFRMVSEKKKQETATEYDVLRAQVDVATYRAKMISEQNAIDTNRVALLKNMGVSQDSEISFSDKLEFLPMRPVFERAVEVASGLRPDLRQAELDARIAAESVRITQSEFWPTLNGFFSQNWTDGWNRSINHDSFGRNPWQAGLRLSYVFGIDNIGNLRSSKARAKQSMIAILDKQETALKEIRQYMNSLDNAEEMVKALEVNQDAAREALRLVLVGYQAGVKTEVDVTDARKALTDVMGQYYSALTDHTKARLNLQVAMGVLGPTCISDTAVTPPTVPVANITEFAATDYVPPTPIPMPTANDMQPVSRVRREDGPLSAAPAARNAPLSPNAFPPEARPAPAAPRLAPPQAARPAVPVQAQPSVQPQPAAPAAQQPTLGAADKYAPLTSPATASVPAQAPAASAFELPPPPADAYVVPPSPAPAVVQAAPARTESAERPLFRIRVREGSELPEMAQVGK